VVLAILVLLFGLLFAPMMTSLDIARQGQKRARMQDVVRYTMEEVRRTLGNARYILPMDVRTPTAAPNLAYVDLSTITAAVPQRDARGILTSPLEPTTRPVPPGARWLEAIRFTVHPWTGRIVRNDDLNATEPPGATQGTSQPGSGIEYTPEVDNPFVLFRQVGVCYEASPGQWVFGSVDAAGSFVTNQPISENAMTLGSGFDVPCSGSVCDNCGYRHPGFRAYASQPCVNCGAQAGYTYLFDGIRFVPEQVAGEQVLAGEGGTVYRARHGGWTGYGQTDPTVVAPGLSERRLDPRIIDYRFDATDPTVPGGAFSEVQYDSYNAAVRGTPRLNIAWDPESGGVKFGRRYTQRITLTAAAGTGNVSMALSEDEATVTALDPPGTPTPPTGYSITPAPDAAIILPSTVRVRMIANFAGGGSQAWDLVKTNQQEQDAIGPWQYAVRRELPPTNWAPWLPEDWATSMDILFNNLPVVGPPGPTKLAAAGIGNVTSVDLVIDYWARRNADIHRGNVSTGRDDIVRIDYNTRNVLDVDVGLAEFVDYQEDVDANLVIPPPPPPTPQVALNDTVIVHNAGG